LSKELLEEAVTLTHPDRHPPERQELASRVTADLLALRAFVKPKPSPPVVETPKRKLPVDGNAEPSRQPRNGLLASPCPRGCRRSLMVRDYCDDCRAWWEEKRRKERAEAAEYQREYRRRQRAARFPIECQVCGATFKGRRDALYCSPACRQKAYRHRCRKWHLHFDNIPADWPADLIIAEQASHDDV
jgi:hypothetical protein